MSRYPVYGVQEDPVWSRGGSVVEPVRGQSHPPVYPTMPYAPYPTHTTVIHSAGKPPPDADFYK